MTPTNYLSIKIELKKAVTKPYRLLRTLLISSISTLGWLIISVNLHVFHKGLPYATAELFIWTLASYNASQLGSDSNYVLNYTKQKGSLRELLIIKNATLLIISLPIDIALVSLTCWSLHDWSHFWLAIPLAIIAVIISLGLGNVVSVAWVYRPISYLKMRHNRPKIADYLIFVTLSYLAASFALTLTTTPGSLLLHVLNINSHIDVIIGLLIIFVWAAICWTLTLNWAVSIEARHSQRFIAKLSGDPPHIKSTKIKKILKVQ